MEKDDFYPVRFIRCTLAILTVIICIPFFVVGDTIQYVVSKIRCSREKQAA